VNGRKRHLLVDTTMGLVLKKTVVATAEVAETGMEPGGGSWAASEAATTRGDAQLVCARMEATTGRWQHG
jgi:hypothetical protein